ncbi:ankyrin repeat domain-containing protein [Pedobacter changchengzhani]|uniref:Ankyrin repeat domain-containing protein n=1 Tax=Pedobacter changchengzhani TaxID=2529274 RepID=A0A4R5MLK7_9SPHI|nr:ankyrin repeat domain-containing protein [Pedobacter changchengzhani]TDG36502.1 ankyrin repeat domain-containing protein [Pedobacter changchengzhani]
MKKIFLIIFAIASMNANAQKNSFLNQSFWKGNPDVTAIKTEIAKGNSASELSNNAMDAVVLAINNNASEESILYLLAQPGNDVNKITHDGRTYLFWAMAKGNLPVTENLLKNGAKVNVQDSHGYSPLMFALNAGQKDTKIYDLLIENGVDLKKELNPDGANALLIAIPNDEDFLLTNYFISKGLDLNSKDASGNTAFNYVAKSGNIDLMNKLISKGVKFNDNAMIMAAQGSGGRTSIPNSLAVFQYLEGSKIKPKALGTNGETALFYIGRKPNQQEIINYFISKGVDVNLADKDGNTAFIMASGSNKDLSTIKLLAKNIQNINHVNLKGTSALAMAFKGNSAEIVQFLVDSGADLSAVDKRGDNIASYLFQGYSTRNLADFDSKLKLLTDKGFDFKTTQSNGNSLYHLALAKNDLSLLKRLEPLKIDVNLKNADGYTVLHKAAMTAKNVEILNYLISIGAKKDATTEFKETAYDLAAENEFLTKNKVSIDFLK